MQTTVAMDAQQQEAPSSDAMLTRKELAARWHLHAETLRRWERSGRLPFFVMGTKLKRYRMQDVLRLEAEMHVAAEGVTR